MRRILVIALASFIGATAAHGQQLSEQMTCEEAIAHFAQHGSINTAVNGTVLPISQGTPIAKADLLTCRGGRFDTMVKTKDKAECVIAAYCG